MAKVGSITLGGVQFQKVGGGAQTINDLIMEDNTKPLVGAGIYGDADQLDVWDNASGQYNRFYFGDWFGDYGVEFDKLWYVAGDDEAPADNVLPLGAGFRLTRQSKAAAAIIMVGEVVSTNIVLTLKAGTLNQISNPYPISLKLADISNGGNFDWINSGFVGAGIYGDADQLMIWNPTTQIYDRYYFGDWAGEYGAEFDKQWYVAGDDTAPVTGIEIPAGASFIINLNASVNNVNLTLIAPNLD